MKLLTGVWLLCFLTMTTACAHRAAPSPSPAVTRVATISVVATTDLHGHIESLPWLGGHLANLRARRRADGGGVLLVDAGDMFQGTLESNLGEGRAVVRAYNALGYGAVAIGNHEFDFGPVGRAHVPVAGEDPRGALKARAAEASFPFLAANLVERGSRASDGLAWRNVRPWVIVDVAGARIGVVGGTTMGTPRATHPRNFAGLAVRPLAETVVASARLARQAGAQAVLVAVHAGGRCSRFDQPEQLASCQADEEVFQLARALPPGLVDAIAAGHTHQGVAHQVNGVAIVQAHAEGRAFSRIDLRIDVRAGRVLESRIFAPRGLCAADGKLMHVPSFDAAACRPPAYEGRPVAFDHQIAALIAPDVAQAAEQRARPLGVEVESPIWRARLTESPLGNLAADLMRAGSADVDLAFINGGSLRADLPAGPLTYGRLYQAFPFDDALARVRLRAADVAAIVARNLERGAGILSLSGLRAEARCQGNRLQVTLRRPDGQVIAPDTILLAVTNGYLASGGDGLLTAAEQRGVAGLDETAQPMRDRFVELLAARPRSAPLRGDDRSLFDEHHLRVQYPGARPVRCDHPPARRP
jgi:2',3'-cyclic-nucleotide 2'-phosphodiesterase (5'-nucleotidase family)